MRTRNQARIALGLPAIVFSAYALMAAAPPKITACTVTSDSVRIGEASGTVMVRYTDEIGDSLSASVAPASKIMISSVRRGGTPLTGELTVNSEQAVAGTWDLTLNGPKGTCSGTVAVVVAKKKS